MCFFQVFFFSFFHVPPFFNDSLATQLAKKLAFPWKRRRPGLGQGWILKVRCFHVKTSPFSLALHPILFPLDDSGRSCGEL